MKTTLMNLFKPGKMAMSQTAANTRRSFMWKMGAGVSTALASTAGMASSVAGSKAAKGEAESLALQLALLQEEKKLRELHRVYENAMDKNLYGDALALFADHAEVIYNGGVFKNKDRGVSRLYHIHFAAGMTGQRMEPAPGFALDADSQKQELLEVSPDLLTAKAVFPYSIRVGKPVDSDTSLASMARVQGEGVHTWWEGGVYDVSYTKDVVNDSWRISKLEYKTLSRADYRVGRTWAGPISVAKFQIQYPEDRQGPDALV